MSSHGVEALAGLGEAASRAAEEAIRQQFEQNRARRLAEEQASKPEKEPEEQEPVVELTATKLRKFSPKT